MQQFRQFFLGSSCQLLSVSTLLNGYIILFATLICPLHYCISLYSIDKVVGSEYSKDFTDLFLTSVCLCVCHPSSGPAVLL